MLVWVSGKPFVLSFIFFGFFQATVMVVIKPFALVSFSSLSVLFAHQDFDDLELMM